jgi:hypothetical protein
MVTIREMFCDKSSNVTGIKRGWISEFLLLQIATEM